MKIMSQKVGLLTRDQRLNTKAMLGKGRKSRKVRIYVGRKELLKKKVCKEERKEGRTRERI